MCNSGHDMPVLRLQGSIVEIVEEGGHRRAKVSLAPSAVIELGDLGLGDLRLGEPVEIEAELVGLDRPRAHAPHAGHHPAGERRRS